MAFTLFLIFLIMVIIRGPSSAQNSDKKYKGAVLQGRVLSPYGPVENARVRVAGEEGYTLTD